MEDYFDDILADVLEQDYERCHTTYMPDLRDFRHREASIDDFIGDDED